MAALVGLALGVALPVGGSGRVEAEEQALLIHLAYSRGYSNWGPTNVSGAARLWPSEGVVVLTTHNLPHLLGGDLYVAWLVNTVSGESLRLDSFNTSQAGDAEMDKIFNQPLPRGANALLVTLSHPGAPATLPGPQRTLVGYFPAQHTAPVISQPTPPATATPVPAPPTAIPAPSAPPTATPPASHPTPIAHGGKTMPGKHQGQQHHGGQSSAPGRHHSGARGHRPVVVILPQTGGGQQMLCHRRHACHKPATKFAWQNHDD